MDIVCPISDVGTECWDRPEDDINDGVDLQSWLKEQLIDGLDHELAHALTGPALWGYREDGSPNFEVFRQREDGPWLVRKRGV